MFQETLFPRRLHRHNYVLRSLREPHNWEIFARSLFSSFGGSPPLTTWLGKKEHLKNAEERRLASVPVGVARVAAVVAVTTAIAVLAVVVAVAAPGTVSVAVASSRFRFAVARSLFAITWPVAFPVAAEEVTKGLLKRFSFLSQHQSPIRGGGQHRSVKTFFNMRRHPLWGSKCGFRCDLWTKGGPAAQLDNAKWNRPAIPEVAGILSDLWWQIISCWTSLRSSTYASGHGHANNNFRSTNKLLDLQILYIRDGEPATRDSHPTHIRIFVTQDT